MKNIETILAEAGIELTDEQKAAITKGVKENYRTITDYDQQIAKRDAYKTQYEDVKGKLEEFDGVDLAGLQKQITDAQAAVKEAEEKAREELAARDYADAVRSTVDSLKFSSNAARKAFMQDLIAKALPLEEGKLLGFNDYVEAYKANDAGAIVDSAAKGNAAKFTEPMSGAHDFSNPKAVEFENQMREAMGLKPTKE